MRRSNRSLWILLVLSIMWSLVISMDNLMENFEIKVQNLNEEGRKIDSKISQKVKDYDSSNESREISEIEKEEIIDHAKYMDRYSDEGRQELNRAITFEGKQVGYESKPIDDSHKFHLMVPTSPGISLAMTEERIKYSTKAVSQIHNFYNNHLEDCDDVHLTFIYLARANDGNKQNSGRNVALARTDENENEFNIAILGPARHQYPERNDYMLAYDQPDPRSGMPTKVADQKMDKFLQKVRFKSETIKNTKSLEAKCVHELSHILHAEASPDIYWQLKGMGRDSEEYPPEILQSEFVINHFNGDLQFISRMFFRWLGDQNLKDSNYAATQVS